MKAYSDFWMLALAAPIAFTACATITPPQPPSLDLPKPPADLRATRKGDQVTLTWTMPSFTTDRQRIRNIGPTEVCRSTAPQITRCGTPVGEVPAPSGTTSSAEKVAFSDTIPAALQSDNPAAVATYAVEVLNHDGRGAGLSNPAQVSLVHTLPPPEDFQARVTAQGIVVSWIVQPPPAETEPAIHHVIRVYRQQEGGKQIMVGELPLGGDHSITDSGIEWEKTYEYRADTVTIVGPAAKTEVQVEGNDTPGVKVFADDVFPPAVPSGLQAVFSGPGQQPFVDLIWAPDTDLDLAGYNVYRHEQGAAPVRVNPELLKTPAYRDTSVGSGKTYFYSVSAVDLRGNESARSQEAAETIP